MIKGCVGSRQFGPRSLLAFFGSAFTTPHPSSGRGPPYYSLRNERPIRVPRDGPVCLRFTRTGAGAGSGGSGG